MMSVRCVRRTSFDLVYFAGCFFFFLTDALNSLTHVLLLLPVLQVLVLGVVAAAQHEHHALLEAARHAAHTTAAGD